MKPYQLIGLPYRLGADPVKHHAADCLTLALRFLEHYDIKTPIPKRDWYRRLRRHDYSVFEEQLNLWGVRTNRVELGTVALCPIEERFGLAVYYEKGWINCKESGVCWRPIDGLRVHACYYPLSSNFVKS